MADRHVVEALRVLADALSGLATALATSAAEEQAGARAVGKDARPNPELLTLTEAAAIARMSRWSLNKKTRGMAWRVEFEGKTLLERGPFLRWLDTHRAGPAQQQRVA